MGSNISSFASTRRAISTSPTTATSMCWTPKASSCSRSTTASTAAASCRLQPNQVGILWYNYATGTAESTDENGQFFIPVDLETKTWGEKIKMPANVWNASIRATTPTISITRTTTTSMATPSRAIRRDKLVDWMACDVDTSNMYDSGMLLRWPRRRHDGGLSSDTTAYQLIVLHRIDAPEVKEKDRPDARVHGP